MGENELKIKQEWELICRRCGRAGVEGFHIRAYTKGKPMIFCNRCNCMKTVSRQTYELVKKYSEGLTADYKE